MGVQYGAGCLVKGDIERTLVLLPLIICVVKVLLWQLAKASLDITGERNSPRLLMGGVDKNAAFLPTQILCDTFPSYA
jgi:hypothetical protein